MMASLVALVTSKLVYTRTYVHKQAPKRDTLKGHSGEPQSKEEHGDKFTSRHDQQVDAYVDVLVMASAGL